MSRGQPSKIGPAPYVSTHLHALAGPTGGLRPRDIVEQFAVPVAAGLGVFAYGVEVEPLIGTALIMLASLLGAFMFQLAVQLLDRAAAWAESSPDPGRATSNRADLMQALCAHAAYSAMVAVLAAGVALAASVARAGTAEHALAGATATTYLHLAATLLLVTRRVFLLSRTQLNAARTGAGRSRNGVL